MLTFHLLASNSKLKKMNCECKYKEYLYCHEQAAHH